MARDYGHRNRSRCRLRLALTSGVGGTRSLEFRAALSDGQYIYGQRPAVIVDRQLKPIAKEILQHDLRVFGRRSGRSFGEDIESVRIQPWRPSDHFLRGDAVGGLDKVHHRSIANFISLDDTVTT